MIPNNGFSLLTCQVLSSKEDIESILQRITLPFQTLDMTFLTGTITVNTI